MPQTAQSSFTIAAKSRSFQLDTQGKGICTFTVANTGQAALEGRVRLTPTGQNPAVAEWLVIAEPAEQTYKPNEERAYSIAITVPPDARGGTYLFRAEAYSIANPNDDYVCGPEFSFSVVREEPATATKRFPLWIPFTALALLIAVASLVMVLMMGRTPADAPTAVPALVGKDEAEATRLLVEAHLVVGSLEKRPSADAKAGTIIAQDPEAGGEIPANSPVDLVVAMQADAPTATVPDVIGRTQEEARKLLAAAKLTTGVVGEDPDAPGAAGTVVRQAPAAGVTLGLESAVSLVVKAKPAPTGTGPIAWQGSFSVRQTWHGDVDAGRETDAATQKDADFWFLAQTATERFIEAQNNVQFGFPTEPTLAACREAIALAPVTRIPVASLKPEKLIAIRTNLGRYALLTLAREVGPSPGTLEVKFVRFFIRVFPIHPALDIKALPVKPVSEVKPLQPKVLTAEPARITVPAKTVEEKPRLERRELIR
jgi:hypothetical protein